MPFPSLGCQTCKIRRIKCDEGQPICQKCVKSRRICHGTKAKQAHTIVHENSYASGQKKRPRGPRPIPLLTGSLNAALQGPIVDLKSQAIGYYMHYHLRPLTDILNVSKGTADNIMPMWLSKANIPTLDLALSSISLAIFSKTHQYPPAATEASLAYQRLLRIVRASLQSLISGNIDVCLLTIFFMGRYEDAMHDSCKLDTKTTLVARFRSFSHHDGALAVLKIWKDHLSHNHPATETIKYIRRGLIRSALMRNNAVAEWMIDGAYFSERDLDLEYDRIVVQITIVRQRLAILILMQSRSPCGSHELLSKVEGLNYEIRNIDNALQDWTCRFPRVWSRRQHTLSKDFHWTTQDFYSPIVYSYLNLSNAAVWNKYYVTRMLAISVRLRVLELYHQDLDGPAHGQRLECISHMKSHE